MQRCLKVYRVPFEQQEPCDGVRPLESKSLRGHLMSTGPIIGADSTGDPSIAFTDSTAFPLGGSIMVQWLRPRF